ncbi:high choriolytic enzyme 2-like [Archocentrus centrarchus]|uniref:high choriolytic enzyme 2-like n=1 Tax=Archocentrus centrarchus TaxID=63155 RepID=UPI0011E9CCBA|nr:high choriolytic enzyme 2-like [Archocentrus centrarchus]
MIPTFLFLLFLSMTAVSLRAAVIKDPNDESLGAVEIIKKVNTGSSKNLVHGDIVLSTTRNADPCTAIGCKWPKIGSYVYIPVSISSVYSTQERNIIINALVTFHESTCIRFVWKTNQVNSISFFSGDGCYSYVGRQSQAQLISLQRNGCLYLSTVQHEVLHALGFHHEQVRSDRDQYVSILTQNIMPGTQSNFEKKQTNNLQTSYDFNSVMHYPRTAFSRNGQPTIVAKSNPNLDFGRATQMSANDIARINRLYGCCE